MFSHGQFYLLWNDEGSRSSKCVDIERSKWHFYQYCLEGIAIVEIFVYLLAFINTQVGCGRFAEHHVWSEFTCMNQDSAFQSGLDCRVFIK